MWMTKDEFAKNIDGFTTIGCAVRNARVFYFTGRNLAQAEEESVISEGNVDKRVISFFLDDPEDERWSSSSLRGFERLVGSASKLPLEQMVVVDNTGLAFAIGSGSHGTESIPELIDKRNFGAITRSRTIDGYVYVVGSDHMVCRRLGKNDWKSLNFNLPRITQEIFDDNDRSYDFQFWDIAGFSQSDLYTIGGRGVVWHFDGKKWMQIPFPTNMFLHSVCCAGDGNVYIGAQAGALFCGRGSQWKMINRGNLSLPFKDIVWHAGRVWCTNDYGLWIVENGKLVDADIPAEIKVCAGHLSAADGVMLMAGDGGAAFHDGEKWQLLFNKYEMGS